MSATGEGCASLANERDVCAPVGPLFGIVARRRSARDDSELARAHEHQPDVKASGDDPRQTNTEAMRRFEERIGRLIPIDTEGVTPPQSAHDDHNET